MNSLNEFRFDDPATIQAWETYQAMRCFPPEPRFSSILECYILYLRQIPNISAMNFLKIMGFDGFDSYEALLMDKNEYQSYMNFIGTLNGV